MPNRVGGYDVIAMLMEGRRDNQLEYLTEFPRGTFYLRVQDTNMFRAKEILGDRACLAGNVPISLLCAGSPSEVEEYCKKLIQVCGKNGGFILSLSQNDGESYSNRACVQVELAQNIIEVTPDATASV